MLKNCFRNLFFVFFWFLAIGLLFDAQSIHAEEQSDALILPVDEVVINIELSGNLTPISDDLANFIALDPNQITGFNGTDIGDGPGDGVDEIVPFSFVFPQFSSISSAMLTLILTPKVGITTDNIIIADNFTRDPGFGNDLLKILTVDKIAQVTFDLANIDIYPDSPTKEDLTHFLLDGDLDVVFADDALLHSATLSIIGTPADPN
jgi:hypothetical protein